MGDDDLTTAERALSDAALAGDPSAQALCAEIERLRRIEMEVERLRYFEIEAERLSKRESGLLNTCSVLTSEIERLRAIEAAARAAYDAEQAWRENGGMNPGLAGAMLDAQTALRKALAKGGAR